MHIEELQRIVLKLSNSGWCRYWIHFNYPQNPTIMAVQCFDWGPDGFAPAPIYRIEEKGFKLEETEVRGCSSSGGAWIHNYIYTIGREDDDGKPYNSSL